MRLTAIRNLLAAAPDSLDDADRNSFSLGLLWAQSVALKSSSSPGSQTYARALTAELSRIAWIVDVADVTTYDEQAGAVSPGGIVRQILTPYLGSADEGLADLLGMIERGTVPQQLGSFLTTWWTAQRNNLSASAFAIGPLSRNTAGLSATILFYAIGLQSSTWQSFFVGKPDTRFDVAVLPVTLVLNADLWRQIEGSIAAKLGGAAAEYIKYLNIDV